MSNRARRVGSWLIAIFLVVSTLPSLATPAAGQEIEVLESKYVSSTFGYSIDWSSPWFLLAEERDSDFDYLHLSDGQAFATFSGGKSGQRDPLVILQALEDQMHADPTTYGNVEIMVDEFRVPMRGSDSESAYSFYEYSIDLLEGESIDLVNYVEVRLFPGGLDVVMQVEAETSIAASRLDSWIELFSWVDVNPASVPPSSVQDRDDFVQIYVEPGVKVEDIAIIGEGIGLALRYLDSNFGFDEERVLKVTALPIANPDSPSLAGVTFGNATLGNAIVFYTDGGLWGDDYTPLEQMGIVVHEFVHVYQNWAMEEQPLVSPAWFEEGLAEYVSADMLAGLEISDREDFDALNMFYLSSSPPSASLEILESPLRFQEESGAIYALSYFAIARLLELSRTDLSDIPTYYSLLASGTDFESAFSRTFGLSLSQFYADFESWLLENVTPTQIPSDFDPGAQPPNSEVTLIDRPYIVATNSQFLFTAQAGQWASCRLRIVLNNNGQVVVDRSTFANGSGELFWLVTIPADTQLGNGEVTASCGSIRDKEQIVVAR